MTPEEQALAAAVDAANPQALALLERVVNINSGSMNFAGVRAVGDVFRRELDALGFTTRWVDGAPFNRAGHLVAERQGSGPRVLLIGHLDTVFEPDSPFQRFERIDERTARGPGIIDMKGGDVVMIHALKALHAVKALDRLRVTVVMTGDEELTGEPLAAARAALVEAAKERGHRDRLRGWARRSEDRGHRAAGNDGVAAAGQGEAGALVADLPGGHRLRRDLRSRQNPEQLPRNARQVSRI